MFYYVTSGSNMTRDVHWCVTVFYQQIENSNIANQIHGFTIDYDKFILIVDSLIQRVGWDYQTAIGEGSCNVTGE